MGPWGGGRRLLEAPSRWIPLSTQLASGSYRTSRRRDPSSGPSQDRTRCGLRSRVRRDRLPLSTPTQQRGDIEAVMCASIRRNADQPASGLGSMSAVHGSTIVMTSHCRARVGAARPEPTTPRRELRFGHDQPQRWLEPRPTLAGRCLLARRRLPTRRTLTRRRTAGHLCRHRCERAQRDLLH